MPPLIAPLMCSVPTKICIGSSLLWFKYKQASLNLMAASIITNAAFNLVRRKEHELMKNMFGIDQLSYHKLSSEVFWLEPFSTKNLTLENLWRTTPFDELVFYLTALILEKYKVVLAMGV
jgi:hypothetical protein